MKRFLSATAATGLALTMVFAPLAAAQQDQQHGAPPGGPPPMSSQHAPEQMQHVTMQHSAQHAPMASQHVTVVHQQNIYVHHQTVVEAHSWHRGDRFSDRRVVVSDWHRYPQAYAPPPGYEWVQDGDQLVLIAVASGVIATVLANALAQ